MPKPKMVKKTIEIPLEDYKSFESRHPGYGSFTWFVRAALKKYNELNEVDVDELVELSVSEIRLHD